MNPQLQIQLFETFTLSADGVALKKLSQRERSQSLLGYLILHRGQEIPRSQLAFTLWPDSTDEQARTNLRRELHHLKQDLPEFAASLSVSNKTLRWNENAPYDIDVIAFEAALQAARIAGEAGDTAASCQDLERAARFYKGMLLPHLYDEWLPSERDRLERLAIQGLLALVAGLKKLGNYRPAIAYVQQVLRQDNLNEEAHLHAIELHALSGDRATALRLYHDCLTLFREELGIDPGAALQALYDNILAEPAVPSAATPAPSPQREPVPAAIALQPRTDWGEAPDTSAFYGRSEELQTLQEWVSGDRCRLVAIIGLGGMGKTTLATKFTRQVAGNTASEFDCIVWRSLRHVPTWPELAADLITVLSNRQETEANPARLMHWLRQFRCLVVLDNVESVLQDGNEAGHCQLDREDYCGLFRLLAEGDHQSCLLITSREKPLEVSTCEGADLPVRSLSLAGSAEVAEAIVCGKGLLGTNEQRQKLGLLYDNMPLALKIVSSSICELFDGDIETFLAEEVLIVGGLRRLLDRQFERLSPLEQNIMDWLALSREWISIRELAGDLHPPVSRNKVFSALESLCWRSLIVKQQGRYTLQPVVMEYCTEKAIERSYRTLAKGPATDADYRFQVPLFSHALMKATAADFIRDLQRSRVLLPVLRALQDDLGSPAGVVRHLRAWLDWLQALGPEHPSYAAGNLINLLVTARADLSGWDLSNLAIWQAYLKDTPLHGVTFANAGFERTVFADALSAISDLDWSTDGMLLVTADVEGNAQLWEARGERLLKTFCGPNVWIHAVAFAPDGQCFATGNGDATVRIWTVETGNLATELHGHQGRVWSVAFQPLADSRSAAGGSELLASGSEDGTINLWHPQAGEVCQTLTGSAAEVNVLCWLDRDRLIAGSSDRMLRIWSTNGACLAELSGPKTGIRSLSVCSLPNSGAALVACGSQDGQIDLWHLEAGWEEEAARVAAAPIATPIATLETSSPWVWSLDFKPDGRYLVSGHDDGRLYWWETEKLVSALARMEMPDKAVLQGLQRSVRISQMHESKVWGLAFDPSGERLATGGKDRALHIWDVARRVGLKTFRGHSNWVQDVAFEPQGNFLLSGHEDASIRAWDLGRGTLQQRLQGHSQSVWAIAIASNGEFCISSGKDGTIRQWDLRADNQDTRDATLVQHQGRVWSVAIAPGDRYLAWGNGSDNSIVLWNRQAGAIETQFPGHDDCIWSVAFGPDGRYLASGSSDGDIRLWSLETRECWQVLKGHRGWVFSLCWSPDSKTLASGGGDGTIRLWNVETGTLLATLTSDAKLMLSVRFSPDGRFLASGSDDRLVRLWDAATRQCIANCIGHQGWVWSVAFSPDGKALASGSQDSTIGIWDVETGKLSQQLQSKRLYEGMDLTGITGFTTGQKDILRTLGGICR